MTTDGLVRVGTIQVLTEAPAGTTQRCGSFDVTTGPCVNYLIYTIADFAGTGDGALYEGNVAAQLVVGATWTIGGNWELEITLDFFEADLLPGAPIGVGFETRLILTPDNFDYSLGSCTQSTLLGPGFGLCGSNLVGGAVPFLTVVSQPVHRVPEPAAIAIFGLGLAGLGFFMTRRRRVV